MTADDAMDVDEPVAAEKPAAPLRIQVPGSASTTRIPFPTSKGPPSPTKQQHQSFPSNSLFRRPSSPDIAARRPTSSWPAEDEDSEMLFSRRPSSPTKSRSSKSRTDSSRSSSPSKSSWSSVRPPSPTSLPWSEGRVPASPTKASSGRFKPPALRLHDNPDGIDPSGIIGKTLCRVHRSNAHPNLTLVFSDNSSVQVKVEGYHPNARGLSKELEMDSTLDSVLNAKGSTQLDMVVLDCALVRLTDKAFERRDSDASIDSRWDQTHVGIAFKLEGLPNRWYTVWATMTDHDDDGVCKFRSYDDIFLSPTAATPRRPKHGRKKSMQQG